MIISDMTRQKQFSEHTGKREEWNLHYSDRRSLVSTLRIKLIITRVSRVIVRVYAGVWGQ